MIQAAINMAKKKLDQKRETKKIKMTDECFQHMLDNFYNHKDSKWYWSDLARQQEKLHQDYLKAISLKGY